jgi:hypothetical protein
MLQMCWFVGLVLFRTADLSAARDFFAGLFRSGGANYPMINWTLVALAATAAVQAVDYNVRRRPVARCLIGLRDTLPGMLIVAAVLGSAVALKVSMDRDLLAAAAGPTVLPTAGFIYFRF